MRKIILNLLAIFCFCLPSFGQDQEIAETLHIGYCYGQDEEMGDINSPDAKSGSAAILVSPDMTKSLVGNRVESIRVYIPFKLNITSLKVWLRTSLDGENLIEGRADDFIKGWNDVALETPFEIKDNQPFYLGYTFEQKSRAYGICGTGQYEEGGLYYQFDNGAWQTDSQYGNLCLEGVVRGDNLPLYDLQLKNVSVPQVYYLGDNLNVGLKVINHAAATIKGFTLTYAVPGVFEQSTHVDCNILASRPADISLALPPVNLPQGDDTNLTFTITALDNGDDENMANNSCEVNMRYTGSSFKKMVLVEEFTTEKCVNCPTAAPKVYEGVNRFNADHPDGATIICHHSGFYTDFLTSNFDESYLMLYGGSVYAPAAMVDRYAAYSTPVFTIASDTQIYNKILEAYNRPVNYTLEAEASYNPATSKLTVDVKGSRLVEADQTPTRISVVVVENNIPSQRQSGADKSYTHQHAMRTANAAWGQLIDWSGYNFDYSCDLNINDDWKKDDLEIVVYINHYNANNINDCYVENARKLRFPEVNGVEDITADRRNLFIEIVDGTILTEEGYEVENVWNVAGQAVANRNLNHGMYIVKLTGDGTTHIQKVFIP